MSANVTSAAATAGPTYAQIFGPVFWGFCVALMLCGVSALQGYLYFTRYNDKIGVRLVSIYYYMLPHFGSFAPLNAVTKELVVECLISAVITFTSQMYFVYQLHVGKTVFGL
ncbi:hypothetical protein DFH07DRAFT_970194 [Mycena maculata]|uniref:Uncharacterized protein n=1 Tax=Mycena maculata TaxID=230809 RepID=A0AAD7HSW1_9AGAR|nr:hypothetical protein DFH07DRAFT_970194 [Mycena maculata]